MRPAYYDSGIKSGDPNLYWRTPSYLLEPGDPGYVPDLTSASYPKTTTTKGKKMASNPTPDPRMNSSPPAKISATA